MIGNEITMNSKLCSVELMSFIAGEPFRSMEMETIHQSGRSACDLCEVANNNCTKGYMANGNSSGTKGFNFF